MHMHDNACFSSFLELVSEIKTTKVTPLIFFNSTKGFMSSIHHKFDSIKNSFVYIGYKLHME